MAGVVTRKGELVQDPPFLHWLLNDPRAGWVWAIPRIWLGIQWITASSHKLGNAAWMQTGAALQGFWAAQAKVPATGSPAITYTWYRVFIQFMLDSHAYVWFAKLVAIGEITVGIALVIGAFTGVAAFIGGFMNWNFMMAGSASTNPVFFTIAVGLIAAWKVAGYIGADYFLLRRLGTPWRGVPVKAAPKP